MSHAITLGDILIVVGIVGGIFAVLAVIFGLLYLMNPFRSGH